jgi:hypothetical protein
MARDQEGALTMETLERNMARWMMAPPALLMCLVSAGCAQMARPTQTADKAAVVLEQSRCPNVDDSSIADVLTGSAVESWQPAYFSAPGAGAYYKRLAGAAFTVRPVNGYSAEWLDRALECHSARGLLGQLPSEQQANDPFWLPGKKVDIEVASTGKDFLVSVRSLDVADAREIMARARAFTERSAKR